MMNLPKSRSVLVVNKSSFRFEVSSKINFPEEKFFLYKNPRDAFISEFEDIYVTPILETECSIPFIFLGADKHVIKVILNGKLGWLYVRNFAHNWENIFEELK